MAIMRSEPFCKRRCGSNERTRSWRARPEPERLTREVLSARHAPVQHHPERQDHQHHPFDRPLRRTDQRFRWSAYMWSPPPESNRRPHPYHGTTRNRCADRHIPRSRPTVGAKVIGSLSTKLCAQFRITQNGSLSSLWWLTTVRTPDLRERQ